METDSESMTAALNGLSSADETKREQAFETLTKRSRAYLNSVLVGWLPSVSDREDVIEEVFHRAWKMRNHLKFDRLSGWLTYIRTNARHRAIDLRRIQNPAFSIDDPEISELSDAEQEEVDRLIEKSDDCRLLYRVADELFLGLSVHSSERRDSQQLLAAKLLLIDQVPWESVCQIYSANLDEDRPLSRRELDRVCSTPSVIRHLAYSELHWENYRLSEFVLAELEKKVGDTGQQDPKGGHKKTAIILRYRYALLLDQIAHRLSGKLKKSELVALFDSCVLLFPFVEIMYGLIRKVGFIRGAQQELASRGLWERLAFQYYCHNELPQHDIYDRTQAAAAVVGFKMTKPKLNVALSNGRLFKRMSKHLEARERNQDA
jgi:DNA-directed RNA polymerase specialized sigma24 family protein